MFVQIFTGLAMFAASSNAFYAPYFEKLLIGSGGWKFADNRLVKEMVAEERKERSIQIKKLKASRLKRQQIKQERRCR